LIIQAPTIEKKGYNRKLWIQEKEKPPFPIPEKTLKKDLEGFVKILREGMEDKIYKTSSKKEK